MLDEFFVTPPAGFPDHPHRYFKFFFLVHISSKINETNNRGFETVTYMLDGAFTHKDNQGHEGTINAGDLQWMTAGRGIIHSGKALRLMQRMLISKFKFRNARNPRRESRSTIVD